MTERAPLPQPTFPPSNANFDTYNAFEVADWWRQWIGSVVKVFRREDYSPTRVEYPAGVLEYVSNPASEDVYVSMRWRSADDELRSEDYDLAAFYIVADAKGNIYQQQEG